MCGSAGLKEPILANFLWLVIFTHKVGQADLVFGME